MKRLKKMPKEELEVMGYDDIAYLILEETNKKMKITDLFKDICDTLELGDDIFENHIADFFEILTIDQKFIMLDDGYWDLRIRHSEKVVIEEEEDDFDEVESEEKDAEDEMPIEDSYYDEDDVDDDRSEDDLKDLVVIDVDEEEANN